MIAFTSTTTHPVSSARFFLFNVAPRHSSHIKTLSYKILPDGVKTISHDSISSRWPTLLSQADAETEFGDEARSLMLRNELKGDATARHKLSHVLSDSRRQIRTLSAAEFAALGIKHNLLVRVLQTLENLEGVHIDCVPPDPNRRSTGPGSASELIHAIARHGDTLTVLHLDVKTPATFDDAALAGVIFSTPNLRCLHLNYSSAHAPMFGLREVFELGLDQLDVLTLDFCPFPDAGWASFRLPFRLRSLSLLVCPFTTFDALHNLMRASRDTLVDLTLISSPFGGLKRQRKYEYFTYKDESYGTTLEQSAEYPHSLERKNRSLLWPFECCPLLRTVSLTTLFNGSALRLFGNCSSIERLVLANSPNIKPGDVLEFINIHPCLKQLAVGQMASATEENEAWTGVALAAKERGVQLDDYWLRRLTEPPVSDEDDTDEDSDGDLDDMMNSVHIRRHFRDYGEDLWGYESSERWYSDDNDSDYWTD